MTLYNKVKYLILLFPLETLIGLVVKYLNMAQAISSSTSSRVNPARFFSEVKSELKKVTWPPKDQVIRLTGVVIIISLVVGLFIGSLDFIFTSLIQFIIKQ